MTWQTILSSDLVQRWGWVLIHSLWQGLAVAMLLAGVLLMLRRRSPLARYIASCAAMLVLLAIVGVTFALIPAPRQPESAIAAAFAREELSWPTPSLMPAAADLARAPADMSIASRASGPTDKPAMAALSGQLRLQLESALPWLVGGWAMGVILLTLWHLGGWITVQRLRVLATHPADDEVKLLLRRLQKQLKLSRSVHIAQSALVQTPMVVGWLRPVILLPAAILSGLTPKQLEAILAHELAHIRRHDYLANLLQTAVETLLFYHPGSGGSREESARSESTAATMWPSQSAGIAATMPMPWRRWRSCACRRLRWPWRSGVLGAGNCCGAFGGCWEWKSPCRDGAPGQQ